MKRTIFITALLTSFIGTARANLIVSGPGDAPGTACYSESNNTILYKITVPAGIFDKDFINNSDKCPDSFSEWNASIESQCWVTLEDNTLYTCSKYGRPDMCEYIQSWFFIENSEWTPIGENRVVLPYTTNETQTGDYQCTISLDGDYGCDTGYYTTAPESDADMTCTHCPQYNNIDATSQIGNTSIAGCYIPSGTYNDGTGTVVITGNCHYSE